MFHRLFCVFCLCLASAMALYGADAAALKAAKDMYHKAGTTVIEMAQARKVDPAAVETLVLTMQRGAVVLSRAYAAKHPAGTRLIEAVIAQVVAVDAAGTITALGPMRGMPFQEIEDQWHDGAYYKTHDLGVNFDDEVNEHFTDPVHTMVHPMMVLSAALAYQKTGDAKELKAMQDEMDEGIEQAEKMLDSLLK